VTEPYLETLQLLRRTHRALLDVVEDALERAGIANVTATQALLLHGVADGSPKCGELYAAARYTGKNVTYSVNKLVALGLLERRQSAADRRGVNITLTGRGRIIHDLVEALFARHAATLAKLGDVNLDEFATIARSLRRLDQFWSEQIRYRL